MESMFTDRLICHFIRTLKNKYPSYISYIWPKHGVFRCSKTLFVIIMLINLWISIISHHTSCVIISMQFLKVYHLNIILLFKRFWEAFKLVTNCIQARMRKCKTRYFCTVANFNGGGSYLKNIACGWRDQ